MLTCHKVITSTKTSLDQKIQKKPAMTCSCSHNLIEIPIFFAWFDSGEKQTVTHFCTFGYSQAQLLAIRRFPADMQGDWINADIDVAQSLPNDCACPLWIRCIKGLRTLTDRRDDIPLNHFAGTAINHGKATIRNITANPPAIKSKTPRATSSILTWPTPAIIFITMPQVASHDMLHFKQGDARPRQKKRGWSVCS